MRCETFCAAVQLLSIVCYICLTIKINMYGIDCPFYTKTFPTIDELVDDILSSGADPSYEITKDGVHTGEMASDHIAY